MATGPPEHPVVLAQTKDQQNDQASTSPEDSLIIYTEQSQDKPTGDNSPETSTQSLRRSQRAHKPKDFPGYETNKASKQPAADNKLPTATGCQEPPATPPRNKTDPEICPLGEVYTTPKAQPIVNIRGADGSKKEAKDELQDSPNTPIFKDPFATPAPHPNPGASPSGESAEDTANTLSPLFYPTVSQVLDDLTQTGTNFKLISCQKNLQQALTDLNTASLKIGKLEAELSENRGRIHTGEAEPKKTSVDAEAQTPTDQPVHKKTTAVAQTMTDSRTQKDNPQPTKIVKDADTQTATKQSTHIYVDAQTMTDGSMPTGQKTERGLLYFRGWMNPLSAFFPCKIKDKQGKTHESAEHLHHFRKLKHHEMHQQAEEVRKAANAAKAKALARRLLPTHDPSWTAIEENEMVEISIMKAEQCPKFRKALLESGVKMLVHNMESDSRWGFGPDGQGENIMGKALMATRDRVEEFPQHTEPNQENAQTKKKKLLIITDSMLDGLANFFGEESNTDVEVVTFRGGTATSIAGEIDTTLAGKKPTAVVIHCGTNSLDEEDSETIQKAYSKLINGAVWHTGAHIILSGIVHRLDRPDLNGRADTINAYLQSIESDAVSFLDHNATFQNLHRVLDKRGLHLKPAGKRQIADNIWLTLNTTGQATTTGSARPTVRPATWNRQAKPPMVDRPNKRGMTDQE